MQTFSVARIPRIVFGAGVRAQLPALARRFGERVLLVTGARAFLHSPAGATTVQSLAAAGFHIERTSVAQEPSPALVDAAVAQFRAANIDVVIGIGGGSVLDAAKAIAGLLRVGNSVMDYLEGVGPERPYAGPAVPLIALPTTAGTGSEATKNAVLSQHGANGFKKSFRDDKLVAEYALVDPDLLASCPPALIAANGMDALTQLLESFVSLKANPFTDALCQGGLAAARDGLLPWYLGRPDESAPARGQMAYAALLSGITLAQAGLGSVHGLAAPLGAFFPIPHGVACGTLVAVATEHNIAALKARAPRHPALGKYARAAEVLTQRRFDDASAAQAALVALLHDWAARMAVPSLGNFGIQFEDLPRIVANARGNSMKTNPIVLSDAELHALLEQRL